MPTSSASTNRSTSGVEVVAEDQITVMIESLEAEVTARGAGAE